MPRQSLIDLLHEYQNYGRSTAIVQNSGYRRISWSYAEVAAKAAQCAREYERLGIAPGDRILLRGRNSAEWVAAFFGCILRGAVAVPVDRGASGDFTRAVAQQVDAKLMLLDREIGPIGGPCPVILLDSLHEAVGQHSREEYASPPLGRSSTAQIIFTSGSTAVPRGVVISHGNILANLEPLETEIQAYRKWERLVHPLRFLDLVPASHVFGQFMGVWIPPLLGGCVHFQDSLSPAEIISTIRKEKISVLAAVPRVLEALQGKLERDLDARGALEEFDVFVLGALHVIASITGSTVLALAVAGQFVSGAQAFVLSRIDEAYQAEKWGEDAQAAQRAAALAHELDKAVELIEAVR